MCLPREAPLPDAPGIVQGSGVCHACVHVGAMAVALQSAQAALPGGRAGGWGAVDGFGQRLSCTCCMDDGCVAILVRRWSDPAAAAAIVTDLGRVVADVAAVLTGGGKGGGGMTTGGGGGGIKGWIIVLVIVGVDVNIELLTSKSTATVMVAELKAAESRTAIGGAGRRGGCSCQGERVAESVPIRGWVI
jgi:hypothetical protein